MGALELLRSLYRYQAWADGEFLDALDAIEPDRCGGQRHAAIRLMNHCQVVGRIFAAHLTGEGHSFEADNPPETPALSDLRAAVSEVDGWYRRYLETMTADLLSEPVAFTFTDGDRGCMTRAEILTHVVVHGGYHRGEVGQILAQVKAGSAAGFELPWDTYAVHLHRLEPSRRLQATVRPAIAATRTAPTVLPSMQP